MKPLRYLALAALLVAAALLAGCGEKKETIGDTTAVYGPGVTDSAPPWKPEYDHLKERIQRLGLPPVGNEKYHHHAVIHVYNDGILIPVPANVGWLPQAKVYSAIHTHTPDGIIHMESIKPHQFKLGDFFFIWGVTFGKETLGSFHNEGDKQLNVYVNGKRVPDPVNYVIHEGDNIAVGYGKDGSFPHEPDKSALKTVNGSGARQAMCSAGGDNGEGGTSCVNPDAGGDSSSGGSGSPSGGNSQDPGAD
jgi:hypothetical protein